MTTKQLIDFYKGKKDMLCPLTEELIKTGYQQERGGYIKFAYEQGENVDYTKNEPSQWWHLLISYCERTELAKQFPKSVKCGGLYFWMAEVSGCFEESELKDLKSRAIEKAKKINRRNKTLSLLRPTKESNLLIRDFCFEKINKAVEEYDKK